MADITGLTLCNRYLVSSCVGRGGMASVYKAQDQLQDRTVALKLLHDEYAQDTVLLRHFYREADFLRKLDHGNIVRFYGLESDGPYTFMLVEYVDGVTLRSKINAVRGRGMAVQDVQKILRPLSSALYHAHQQGMVHCDIKPANVMVDVNGKVKLTDFGIARLAGTAMTSMAGAGSAYYMAPEQIRGQTPTPKVDIYALGITLYEMLTGGELPFTGETAQFEGIVKEKIFWEHFNLPVPSARKYRPDLSESMDRVIRCSLEKTPQRRYPDCIAFMKDFEKAVNHQTVELKQDTATGSSGNDSGSLSKINRFWPDWLYSLTPILAALLVIAVAVLGLGWIAKDLSSKTHSYSTAVPGNSRSIQQCVRIIFDQNNYVDECVDRINYLNDGKLIFDISWRPHLDTQHQVEMTASVAGSYYLIDNLGRRYDFLDAGGAVATNLTLKNGQNAVGWLRFPSVPPDVTTVILKDADSDVETRPFERFWP